MIRAGLVFGFTQVAHAQGTTTGVIRGTLSADATTAVEGANVRVRNTTTGVTVQARVKNGRFLVQGIEVGGPYVVEVRQIGFAPERIAPLFVSLGVPVELELRLQSLAVGLDTVRIDAASASANWVGDVVIPQSLVQRLPTLNRNFYDFVALAPLVSTKIGFGRSGVSAAGANLRFNGFLINGVDDRFVNSAVSAGLGGGKSVPLDAVKEYSVLVAPYDVRYGEFAGALVNTVTQSGTNEFHGSTFAYWRNARLARVSEPYERLQYGVTLGGPILRDRVHFFVATELQRLTRPATGPYVGQPADQKPSVTVSEADLRRLEESLRRYGLESGSAGPVELGSPSRNSFARLDAAIPRWNSRVVGFVTDNRGETDAFSRPARGVFPLSSNMATTENGIRLVSVELHTDLTHTGGGHNELLVSHSTDWGNDVVAFRQPQVQVAVPATDAGSVKLSAGTITTSQGRFSRGRSTKVRDAVSLPWGTRHLLSLGAQLEHFRTQRGGVIGAYGAWTFANLESLERGVAERYELAKDFGGASAPLTGKQYGAYAGDEWRVHDRFSLTMGLRADRLVIDAHAPYNRAIDSIFGRRTDQMPRPNLELSPRLGFTWDLAGTGRDQLRGGVGLFTGRPPPAWFLPAIQNHGVGIGVLKCGSLPGDAGPAPAFVPDFRAAPTQCATGPALAAKPNGDVDMLARDLRMAQSLRASLAYDRRLPWELRGTGELVVSRYTSDFRWVNLNLPGRRAIDAFGRSIYGVIDTNGIATPGSRSAFSEVIDLRNTSRNYAYQLSARVERLFAQRVGVTASYTWSRIRDVQSPSRIGNPGIVLWADARAVSGLHDEERPETSLNDLPHRVVASVSYTTARHRWPTDLSLYYVGESGSPFTYTATSTTASKGDLNADGANTNDPIYIPRSSADTNEILFSGLGNRNEDNSPAVQAQRVRDQQAAFDGFIEASPCLRRQRGRIMMRNSCREPWTHTTVASVRQAIPIGTRTFETEVDVFNVLNLLNGDWGLWRVSAPRLLEHVGQTAGAPGTTRPIFRFTDRRQWDTLPTESAFQLQVAVRYRF